jgi:aryl-alcohol dehydrogenase-like predicted oxidoreductase
MRGRRARRPLPAAFIRFAGWDVALAQSAASARHFLGLTSEQSLYKLAVRAVEQELIPALRHLGIGLIP